MSRKACQRIKEGHSQNGSEDMKSIGCKAANLSWSKENRRWLLKVFPSPTAFRGSKLIQIDSVARDNLGVHIGDAVEVSKVNPIPLKTVMLDKGGLAPDEVPPSEELKKHLLGRAVVISNKCQSYFIAEASLP